MLKFIENIKAVGNTAISKLCFQALKLYKYVFDLLLLLNCLIIPVKCRLAL